MTDASDAEPDDDDVDLTLRHLTRCFPDELARALLPGARFRIEPVYQYTLDALRARRSALWMVFAPLAVDATPGAMPRVVHELRDALPARRFEELGVAMTVLADADARKRGLRAPIAALLPKELVMQSWVYNQGLEKGLEKGRRQSVALALAARGLKLTPARRAQLDAETRIEVLQTWLTRAVTAARAAVFAA